MPGDRTAVIFGGSGAVGGAVARALAREGARVFIGARGRPRHPDERHRLHARRQRRSCGRSRRSCRRSSLPTTGQIGATVAFLVSDRAGAMTATVVNVTAGLVPE